MQVASVHHEYGRLTLATAGLLFYHLHNGTSISVSLIISFSFVTFLLFVSLCAGLNGQLACQFSRANYASYHIIYRIVLRHGLRSC